ncbi:beta strand repeat-containing protein [Echinicola rosea]|nr:hypothetical protein [Echinicola rosea]
MKNLLLVLLFCLGAGYANAQVGIGTNTPNPSSQLEIVSSDKGVLIPRIALKSVTDNETITEGNIESLLVFNITDSDLISPGYYYWFSNKWRRLRSTGDDANNVIFDPEKKQFFYVNEEGDLVQIDISDLLQETTSTLEEKGDGTYLYTNEKGEETIINVPSDVVNMFTEIVNNTEVLQELVEIIEQNGGNVYYNGDSFSYTTEEGDLVEVSIETLLNETTSTLVDNGDGTYTYKNEEGLETIINVPSDVINEFGDIINNETVRKSITELIENVGGNVYYDGENITYVDEEGNEQVINIEELVKEHETVTTLVDNGDGTYTYSNEEGLETIINVPSAVVNEFGDIINNETVRKSITELIENVGGNVYYDGENITYVDEEGNEQVINIEELVKEHETVTTLVDNGDGTYTYSNEEGLETIINVPSAVINEFGDIINNETVRKSITELIENVGGNVYYDGENITYVDEEGNEQVINIEELVKEHETVTTLVDNGDGTYTYSNEEGLETIINVPSAVINEFGDIINNETVRKSITELIENVGGNVYYDGENITYVDEEGNEQVINIEELVKEHETVTTLVDNGDGTYTYSNEEGLETIINVPSAVVNEFGDIINNETVKKSITELIENVGGNVYYDGENITYVDEEGNEQVINIEELVKEHETVTTLVDNGDGTYTYYNESEIDENGDPIAGTGTAVDIPAGVVEQFEEIINEGPVTINGNDYTTVEEYIQSVGGNVSYDGDKFTYVDDAGDTQTISFDELVKSNETVTTLKDNGDGTYTYTSENNTEISFNITQTGTGDPNVNFTVGEAGDVYVDESTGDVYAYDGTDWVKVGGDGDSITVDDGDPNDNGTPGESGDVYIDNSTGDTYVYNETTGEWDKNTDMLAVENGTVTHTAVDGSAVSFDVTQSGTGDPNGNDTQGKGGDIYVDESTGEIYTYNPTTDTWGQASGLSDMLAVNNGTVTHTAVDGSAVSFDVTQSGTGNPNENGTTGEAGDIYVDETTGTVYTNDGTDWIKVGGDGDSITVDDGDPNDNGTPGEAGDVYIDNSTGDTYVYNPESGEWEVNSDSLTVSGGKVTHTDLDGNTESFDITQSGSGNPNDNVTVGEAGDIYVDETTGTVYTNDGTDWIKVGGDGDSITVDDGDPNDNGTPGEAGDVYIDNSTGDTYVYNPESGEWEVNSDSLTVSGGKVTHTDLDGNTESFDITQSGSGNPNDNVTVGEAGDVYVDESTGDVYAYDGTDWVKVGGDGDSITVDEGDPNDNGTPGEAGDVYIDNSTGDTYVYNPESGEWEVNSDSLTVSGGKVTHTDLDGNTESFDVTQSGTGDPNDNGTVGAAGDIYVDETTGTVYTNDGTDWVKVGGDGDSITVDDGNPNDNGTPGEAGDVYIDNSTGDTYVYNPESGEWEVNSDSLTVSGGKVTHTDLDGNTESFDITQSGSGNPNDNVTVGEAGDVYVDESTGDVYAYDGTDWVKVGGDGDSITVDDGDPNDNGTSGESGDVYIDNSTGDTYVYNETTGEWDKNTDMLEVNNGTVTHTAVDGSAVSFDVTQSGTGDPNDNGTVGAAGDIYVDETTGTVYTNDGTDWVKVGGDGDSITVDEGDPNDNGTPGEAGDVYVDNSTGDTYVYNPESGEWEVNSDSLSVEDGTVTHTAVDGSAVSFDVTQSGTGDPNDNGTVGAAGDIYVDETTGTVYTNDGTDWVKVGGDGDSITVDEGDPNDNGTSGESGDVYIDNSTGDTYVYNETTGEWDKNTDMLEVNNGTVTHTAVDGSAVSFDITQSGPGDPNGNDTQGKGGDIYVDESTGEIYTYNPTTDTWEQASGLSDMLAVNNGTVTHTAVDGSAVSFDVTQSGTGDPNGNDTQGKGGDIYVDESTGEIYTYNPTTDTWEQASGLSDMLAVNNGTVTHTAVDGSAVSFDVTQSGTGNPNGNGTTGEGGDIYVDEMTGDVYTYIEDPDGDPSTNDATWIQTNVTEPWQIENTTAKAQSNTEHIYQVGNVGVGDFSGEAVSVRLDVKDGNVRIREINTNIGTIEAAETGQKDRVLVAGTDGVIKSLKATLPKFFYMPSVLIPVNEEQVPSGDTFGTIDLHSKYISQFTNPLVSSTGASEGIPVLPANELEYHITWFDESLFENVQVSETGVLTYDVIDGAEVYEGSFMNVVFVVKE